MTFDGSHHYAYDPEGRLIQVDPGTTPTATYVYDALGRRVQKVSGGSTVNYVYDLSGGVVAEVTAGVWSRGFVYLNGAAIAQYLGGSTQFFHKDHLGSTRLLTSPNQSLSDNMDFLPFGEQGSGDTGTTHKFTGDERDAETGLDHTLFRKYSSSLGRWTSPDPLYGDVTNPQSLNRYTYVLNNPLAFNDPTGLVCDGANQSWWGSGPLADGTGIFTQDDCTASGGSWGGPGVPPDNGPSNPALSGVCPAQYVSCTFQPNGNVIANSGGGSGYIFYTAPYQDSANGLGYFWAPVVFVGGDSGDGNGSGLSIPTPAEAATKFCEDHGQVASTIRGTNIPITASLSATAGPVNYNTKNEITPVIPAFPWPEWLSFGAGVDVGINVPAGSAPSWSAGLGKNLGISFFSNAKGKTTGVNLNIGLSVGPPVTVSPGSANACGLRAGG